ncbi:MAG TPA: hypothetical protein VL093_14180 [Flavipsychrobacter sp.]|nr:hypothetical protein [Flavipsychrobacter sp.]
MRHGIKDGCIAAVEIVGGIAFGRGDESAGTGEETEIVCLLGFAGAGNEAGTAAE